METPYAADGASQVKFHRCARLVLFATPSA
jgi:hypothetical protein